MWQSGHWNSTKTVFFLAANDDFVGRDRWLSGVIRWAVIEQIGKGGFRLTQQAFDGRDAARIWGVRGKAKMAGTILVLNELNKNGLDMH